MGKHLSLDVESGLGLREFVDRMSHELCPDGLRRSPDFVDFLTGIASTCIIEDPDGFTTCELVATLDTCYVMRLGLNETKLRDCMADATVESLSLITAGL